MENKKYNKYNNLTVIESAGVGISGHILFKCLCDCGKTTVVTKSRLITGHTKSCGCLKSTSTKERNKLRKGKYRVNPEDYALNLIRRTYEQNAKKTGKRFLLTVEEFKAFVQKDCTYCGRSPELIRTVSHNNGRFVYNGLDKIDPSGDYTIGNVTPCCKWCNRAKSELNLGEFKKLITNIYHYWVLNN